MTTYRQRIYRSSAVSRHWFTLLVLFVGLRDGHLWRPCRFAGLRAGHLWRPCRGGENTNRLPAGMNSGHHHCHTTLCTSHNSVLIEPNEKYLYVPNTARLCRHAALRKSMISRVNTTRRATTRVGTKYVHTRHHLNDEPPK